MRSARRRFLDVSAWALLTASVVLLCSPALASAEAERAQVEPERFTLAVTGVKATGKVDPETIEGLDQLVAVEAGRDPRVSVISAADIRAMLGLEAQRQLLACGEGDTCLADLGGALGVGYLLSTEVSRVGKNWLLYVTLLEVATARVIKREMRQPATEDDLVDATIDAVQLAMREFLGPEGGATQALGGVSSGGKSLRPWLRYGGSALGLGLALTGGLAFYGPAAVARAKHRDWVEQKAGVSDPHYSVKDARRYESRADLGLGMMIGGVAIAAAGWGLPALLGKRGPDATAVIITPEGASLALSWRLE